MGTLNVDRLVRNCDKEIIRQKWRKTSIESRQVAASLAQLPQAKMPYSRRSGHSKERVTMIPLFVSPTINA